MEWKNYPDDRLIYQHPDGFYVIKPSSEVNKSTPLFCPMCEGIMKSNFDDETYEKYACCDSCANKWVYRNKEKWLKGWRPSADELININKNA